MTLSLGNTINKLKNLRKRRGLPSSFGSRDNINYEEHPRTNNLLERTKNILKNNFNVWDIDNIPNIETALNKVKSPEDGLNMIEKLFINKTDWYPWKEETVLDLEKTWVKLGKLIEEGTFVLPEHKERLKEATRELQEIEKKQFELEHDVKTKQKEIEQLREEIKSLMDASFGEQKDFVAKLKEQITTQQKNVVDLESEINRLKKQQERKIEEHEKKEKDLQEQIEEIKRNFDNYKLEQTLKPEEEKLKKLLMKDAYSWKYHKEQLKTEFKAIKHGYLTSPWSGYWNSLDYLVDCLNEIDRRTQKIAQLQGEVEKEHGRYLEIKKEKDELLRKLNQETSKVTEKQTKIEELERKIQIGAEEERRLNKKIADLRDENDGLAEEISGLKSGRNDPSKSGGVDWKQKHDQLEGIIESLNLQLRMEKEAHSRCQGDVERERGKYNSKDAELSALQKKMDSSLDERDLQARIAKGKAKDIKTGVDNSNLVLKNTIESLEAYLDSVKRASREVCVLDGNVKLYASGSIYPPLGSYVTFNHSVLWSPQTKSYKKNESYISPDVAWLQNRYLGNTFDVELKVPLKTLRVFAFNESITDKRRLGNENWTGKKLHEIDVSRGWMHGGIDGGTIHGNTKKWN